MGVPGALSDKINQRKCLKRWAACNIKHSKWQQAAEQMHTNVGRTRRKPLTGFSALELIRPVNTAQVFWPAGETSLILNAETRPNIQQYVSLPLIIVVLQRKDKALRSFSFQHFFLRWKRKAKRTRRRRCRGLRVCRCRKHQGFCCASHLLQGERTHFDL